MQNPQNLTDMSGRQTYVTSTLWYATAGRGPTMRLVATPLIRSNQLSQSRLNPALLGDLPAQRAINVNGATVAFAVSSPNEPTVFSGTRQLPGGVGFDWQEGLAEEELTVSGDTVTVAWTNTAAPAFNGIRVEFDGNTFLQAGYVLGPLSGGVPPFPYSLVLVGKKLTYFRPRWDPDALITYSATWRLVVSDVYRVPCTVNVQGVWTLPARCCEYSQQGGSLCAQVY